MPRGIGQLTSFENLSTFMVAKDNSVSKHSGRLGELRDLNNLGGYLEIMNLQHFPPLDQFPSLKRLTIDNLTDLESMESGINCDNVLFFPSVEKLWLSTCPNLKGWRRDSSTPQLLQFHCLDYLEIMSCPNLTSMPLIKSVQHLALVNASKKSLEDILKMRISVSQSTSSCSLISPSQLKILQIENIHDLEFLPEELLPEELDLPDSEDHRDMPWQYLRSLREFQLINMNKLASLPKGLQHVPTLRKLSIDSCPNLKSLPEWMESLTKLQYLWIKLCPQLSERCKNNIGVDWPKIARIPNISIDDRWIQLYGCYKLGSEESDRLLLGYLAIFSLKSQSSCS
ncbi:hypothetical protein GH714_016447 [Hevea brasiliensis]|uniref:NB-ARC domain-containing protein n=1 Tax=Hevea brasiliensis TaxID=3981 RepID=A0A6A6N261_HEVBR|nr:hypothetical protein GH714_016447 [Hevea brasiliensis]